MKNRIQCERVAGMGSVFLCVDFIESVAVDSGSNNEIRVTMTSGVTWDIKETATQFFRKINFFVR